MIHKTIQIDPYDSMGSPRVRHLKKDNVKTASLNEVMSPDMLDFWNSIEVDSDNYSYILVNILGAGEYWGCFPEGAPVLMSDGSESGIEKIKVGDEVITHTGESHAVSEIFVREHSSGLTKITLQSSILSLVSTPNHPVYIIPRGEWIHKRRKYFWKRSSETIEAEREFQESLSPEFISADLLNRGDYVVMPIDREEIITEEIGSIEKAKLLGYYTAEGCPAKRYDKKNKPWAKLIFVTGADEGHLRDDITKCSEVLGRIAQHGKEKNGAVRSELNYASFARNAIEHCGHIAKEKALSPEVLKMPKEWQRHFLAAYLDGDGCQNKSDRGLYAGQIRAVSASPQLIIDLQKLCFRLGIRCSTTKQKQCGTFGSEEYLASDRYLYELAICSADIGEIAPYTKRFNTNDESPKSTSPVHLTDKYAYLPIRNVEGLEWSGRVYNIEVGVDNSYVVNSIAVHNSNKNGDYFPESIGEDRGLKRYYKTFEQGHVYLNHDNDDSQKSIGKIIYASYNDKMHRVEVLEQIDRDVSGAQDILHRIDQGRMPRVSMGCKVPYDICSICGNKASTRADYCEHLKTQMNKLLPDGRQVYAINEHPRFFDASFVHIEADPSSGVLLKVAKEKVLEAIEKKKADIDKEVPTEEAAAVEEPEAVAKEIQVEVEEAPGEIIEESPCEAIPTVEEAISPCGKMREVGQMLDEHDEEFDEDELDHMSLFPLEKILGTMGGMRMKLKPKEVLYITIKKQHGKPFASKLLDEGFGIKPIFDDIVDKMPSMFNFGDDFDGHLAESLIPSLGSRSMFPEHANKRIIIIKQGGFRKNADYRPYKDPHLSRMYGRYIKDLVTRNPLELHHTLKKHGWLIPYLTGDIDDVMYKGAEINECTLKEQLESLTMLFGAYKHN